MAKTLKPFTVDHFRRYAELMVFEDGEHREPEDWQLDIASDIFAGYREVWVIVPEGNGKTTFLSQLALYGADFTDSPWIPIGASSGDQASIMFTQAQGFVDRTPGLSTRFRCLDGYKIIRSLRNGGRGIKVYAAAPKTGDGVIPAPFAIVDELHRHNDLSLYDLWKGKLRKRHAQILAISTAGEPGTPFENMREQIRRKARRRKRRPGYLHAIGNGIVLHEYMVAKDEDCNDIEKVKQANPLSAVTIEELDEEFQSPTLDIVNWKRLKCNRPTRSVKVAISDQEWDDAEVQLEIPGGSNIDVGLDVGWKWDTTALVPLWKADLFRLLGKATILVPPRDGSTLHPDEIKEAFFQLNDDYSIQTVVMDTSKAEDIGSWIEDELNVEVIDRGQTNQPAVQDYQAFMEGLRNGTLKHTGDVGLRGHVLNAIARRLPGGDYRFDRPSTSRWAREQDRRVIDALTAAGMVVEFSNNEQPPQESVYEKRGLVKV